MNARTRPVPLRFDPAAVAAKHRRSLARALVCCGRAIFDPENNPHRLLETTFSYDEGAALVLRGAVSPTDTNASALLQEIVESAVLGSVGAGSQLLHRAMTLSFADSASISLPVLIADASHAAFVRESMPIPAYQYGVAPPPRMEPRKLATVFAMTHEMVTGSNAEVLIEATARRSIGLALDAALFDSAPGDDVRPEGLRHNVAALTASAGADKFEAMLADINALLTAVGPVGGEVVLVANTARAMMMPARSRGGVLPLVLGSAAVSGDALIAIGLDGLVSATTPQIEARASREAAMHFDTAPLPISTPGSPNTIAIPVGSMFQTDTIAQRLKLGVTWQKRHPATVAWLATTTW